VIKGFKYSNAALFIIGLVFLNSCYPEWKLGKTFIETKPDVSVMILPTDYVYKTNLKREDLGDTLRLTNLGKDSLLWVKSLFLKEMSDSVFLETFINSMISEFEALGFKVYMDNATDSFLFFKSQAYILNIAQLQLEEGYHDFKDSDEFGGNIYYKTFRTNAVTFNSWLELTKLNPKKEGRKLFFATETIADLVDGYFTESLITGEIKYKYQIMEIDPDIIYHYCEVLGARYAGYTYDYIMNDYINTHFPPGKKRLYYMHYNRENNTLDATFDDRFELMEE
jgi:hypothetical protein